MKKREKLTLQEEEYIRVVSQTPLLIGDLYYEVKEEKGSKVPRKDSVLKKYKDKVSKAIGVSFNNLAEYQQATLIDTAEDTYYGIREAEK